MEFDTFESLWAEPAEQPVMEKPPLGRRVFEVKGSAFYEDSFKWSLLLVATDGTGAIRKKVDLSESAMREGWTRAKAQAWFKALFAEPKEGKFAEHDWEQYVGRRLSAEVTQFKPKDRPEEWVRYVDMPEPLEGGAENASKPQPRATRTAKIDRETSAKPTDIPF